VTIGAHVVAKSKPLSAIDLFAGAGGLAEGFRQAGYQCLVANDFDQSAGETFSAAFPDSKFIPGPIQDISHTALLELAGLERGELDVLVGGPPCQAFSIYNHQRGMHDERSGMFREYLRIVKGLLPRAVVMENVTGITSIEEGKAVVEIHTALKKLGYTVEHRVLKAEEYGVPQERRRIFLLEFGDETRSTGRSRPTRARTRMTCLPDRAVSRMSPSGMPLATFPCSLSRRGKRSATTPRTLHQTTSV
jgi:DNA-cytosine methyltransferase